jgi:hypothetical protein
MMNSSFTSFCNNGILESWNSDDIVYVIFKYSIIPIFRIFKNIDSNTINNLPFRSMLPQKRLQHPHINQIIFSFNGIIDLISQINNHS